MYAPHTITLIKKDKIYDSGKHTTYRKSAIKTVSDYSSNGAIQLNKNRTLPSGV
jgi:hypothetical protein